MQQSIHDISLSRSPWRYPVLYWQHHPGCLLVAVFHSRTLFVSPSIGIPAVGAELREHTRSVSADATQIQHRIRLLYGGYRTDLMIPDLMMEFHEIPRHGSRSPMCGDVWGVGELQRGPHGAQAQPHQKDVCSYQPQTRCESAGGCSDDDART
jgi:hypothetical protein